jgi:hypothetical protein
MKLAVTLVCVGVSVATIAADDRSDDVKRAEAIAAFRSMAQECKSAPTQEIGVETGDIPGKSVSEPATPEELARLKDLLAASGLPFDVKEHRATYEFALALVRVKKGVIFRLKSSDPTGNLAAVRTCLSKLANGIGLEHRFED